MNQVNKPAKKPYGKIALGMIIVVVVFKMVGQIVNQYDKNERAEISRGADYEYNNLEPGFTEFELQERERANRANLDYAADRIMQGSSR